MDVITQDAEGKALRKLKCELKLPSTPKRKVTLSDIIAATIGEEARDGDFVINLPDNKNGSTTDNISLATDFWHSFQTADFTQQSGNENSNSDCNFLDSSLSNLGTLKEIAPSSNPDNNQKKSTRSGTGHDPVTQFDTQLDFWSAFKETEGTCTLQQTTQAPTDADQPMKDENTTSISDDSDLEDSLHFVDPDDATTLQTTKGDDSTEPSAKKRRYSLLDSSSCPFPIDNSGHSELFDAFDVNTFYKPINSLSRMDKRSPFNRRHSVSGSFRPSLSRQSAKLNLHDNGPMKTPNSGRVRSLSEACKRDSLSPLSDNSLNSSLTTLFESPESSPISNHPFFNDLKSLLLTDCQSIDCPTALFDALAHGHSQDVYARERNLQSKFSAMQNKYPDEVREISSFYRQKSAEVEVERLQEIHDENIPKSYRKHLNKYYDNQLHQIMERVEKSLGLLSSAKTQREIIHITRPFKSRPLLSRKAVKMMEEWFSRNYEHPYPSATAVEALAKAGEISTEQVKKWFANKRNRCKNTKPVTEIANMKRKRQFSARW